MLFKSEKNMGALALDAVGLKDQEDKNTTLR